MKKNKNISVLDYQTDNYKLISSSDVCLCPFTKPHFSRSIIESAALGIPALSTNVGCVNELVVDGKTGFFFSYEDKMDFIKKLNMMMDPEIYKLLSKESINLSNTRYNKKKNSERIFNFVEEVIKGD